MNNRRHRLVFNRLRGMLVAVQETAAGAGKSNRGETSGEVVTHNLGAISIFSMRHTAFAVLMLAGAVPALVLAQVVADPNAGAHRPTVIQTANGLQQVNVTGRRAAGPVD